jgi:hypothetical protein
MTDLQSKAAPSTSDSAPTWFLELQKAAREKAMMMGADPDEDNYLRALAQLTWSKLPHNVQTGDQANREHHQMETLVEMLTASKDPNFVLRVYLTDPDEGEPMLSADDLRKANPMDAGLMLLETLHLGSGM